LANKVLREQQDSVQQEQLEHKAQLEIVEPQEAREQLDLEQLEQREIKAQLEVLAQRDQLVQLACKAQAA
jgi:outer membrane cobalamin receptor